MSTVEGGYWANHNRGQKQPLLTEEAIAEILEIEEYDQEVYTLAVEVRALRGAVRDLLEIADLEPGPVKAIKMSWAVDQLRSLATDPARAAPEPGEGE